MCVQRRSGVVLVRLGLCIMEFIYQAITSDRGFYVPRYVVVMVQ